MMPEPATEIAWPALKRAWRKAQYEELWVQFRPTGAERADALGDIESAVAAANAAVEEAGWGEDVFAEADSISDSDKGPAVLLSRAGPELGVRAWLDTFAAHLGANGRTGKVTAAPEAHFPAWLSGELPLPPRLTAFVVYRTSYPSGLTDQERRAGWNVDAELTQRITDAGVTWGSFEGAEVYLRRNLHQIRGRNPNVARPLADSALRFGMAGVTYLRSKPRRMISLKLYSQGVAVYGVMDDAASWTDRLEKLKQAVVADPANIELAILRHSNVFAGSLDAIPATGPPLPHVPSHAPRYNAHLLSAYTPDAHGMQILTDEHLAHAHDLSDWIIQPLPGGRHLVQATDLAAWYAAQEPDPVVLAKARADFGMMILTPETIAGALQCPP